MDWLPNHEDLVPEFGERFSQYYSHVKAFHGCRPESLSTYYAHGLLGQDGERIKSAFRKIFADVDASDLNRAIERMERRDGSERGRIWFTADDRRMMEEFGHYAIHGSEYLLALAANLTVANSSEDFRLRLRKVGVPTVLEVNIPMAHVPHFNRMEVARMILSEWGQLVTRQPLGMGSAPCYVVHDDIPPECIKAHYHPQRIRDFHGFSSMYINHTIECEMCS
ncbi:MULTISPECIES: hypothetical protein [unclassified Pseudomonas]|uniref:hypothetical protein n=1 Tax=unclassified Pseudomonas TaxID=196821 RepID=UPI001B3253CD|nr:MULTISPECIES: hypothetical protein [unclassified Pseudomonas]